ncbi:STAS domain-containing protein [Streptomyces sp. NPDC006184]|uniref:STAS domain-containing protein n=1 Tax=Streptomyces sp. NPDC006184 TaxID=3155455 RepID=UPI0033A0F6A6
MCLCSCGGRRERNRAGEAPAGRCRAGARGAAARCVPVERADRAAGEVSLPTHGIGERALERAVREGDDVYHLELSALTFVDVAGAGALADAARRRGERRRLVLDRPPAALPRILDLPWPGLRGIEVSAS